MKTLRNIFILLLVALLAVPAYAAPAKSKKSTKKTMTPEQLRRYNAHRFDIHNVYVWGGGGYSGLLNGGSSFDLDNGVNMGSSKFTGLGGAVLGLGYEFNKKRFIFSVGPEFRFIGSQDKLNFTAPYEQTMSEYNQLKRFYFSDMREQQYMCQLTLPVLVGMKFEKWYWKAGPKLGYALAAPYRQSGSLKVTLTDPNAYSPDWENLISHGAGTSDYLQQDKNKFGIDLGISAEAGINLDQFLSQDWINANEDRARPIRMRVALFADFGFINQTTGQTAAFAKTTENSISTVSLMQSQWTPKLYSMLVGVKFTAMLQMNKVRELKKQNGYLSVFTYDTKTDRALSSVALTIQGEKGKPVKKATNSKGIFSKRQPEGDYVISASRTDYIGVEGFTFSHGEDNDTARIGLRPVPVYTCSVSDAKSGKFLASSVQFINVATDEVVRTLTTDSVTGACTTRLPLGAAYRVHISATDHFAFEGSVSDIDGTDSFSLEPIIKKRKIILHNLFFATNEVTILPQSEAGLQDLYDLLNENPEIRIRITGHTDAIGSEEANQILSEGRANSVRDNMIERGIDPARIEAEGKGESEPVDTNDTEEGRANNRRVEFVIL